MGAVGVGCGEDLRPIFATAYNVVETWFGIKLGLIYWSVIDYNNSQLAFIPGGPKNKATLHFCKYLED